MTQNCSTKISSERKWSSITKTLKNLFNQRPELVLAPLLFVVVVSVWEFLVYIFSIPRIVLPAPSAIARSLNSLITVGNVHYHFGITLYETMAGFFIGGLSGLILGILVSQFRLVEKTLYPYIVAFQAVPKVAIAPLIIIWAGYGYTSKIIITATIAFFPLLVNTIAGLRATEPEYIEMLTGFTATRWKIFRMVKVPMAMPYIFAGLDIAGVMSVIGAIVGEFVGSRAGLGYLILHRNFQMDMPGVFALLIILALMGIAIHLIINWLHRKIVFWKRAETERVIGA